MATQNTLTKANVSIETGSKSLGTATIKAKNSSHIVQVLVNTMYANKEASSVREILSNAIDAHNMSNNTTDKVEIQVPTKTFPMLRIRDFGNGLSPEFMSNEYLSLGHSEKRDRNDAVGFMGLGRFALFSLFKSYFVTSYYNGVKYPYSIHLDTNGDIAIEVMDGEIEKTNEKNGLEVFVMIDSEQRMVNFQQEILKLTFFCKDKVSLVNLDEDELPSWYNINSLYTFGNISIYKSNDSFSQVFNINPYSAGLVGVYDNIPYTIGPEFATTKVVELLGTFKRNFIVTIDLPIGKVERTASREGLERDKDNKTWDALNLIASKGLEAIQKLKKSLVSDVKTFDELSLKSSSFFDTFNTNQHLDWTSPQGISHRVTNQGFASDIFRVEMGQYIIERNGRLKYISCGVNAWRSTNYTPVDSIFLYNDSTEREQVWKSKIKHHLKKNPSIKKVFLFDTNTPLVIKFLEEINAPKLSLLDKPVVEANAKDKEIICFHNAIDNYNSNLSYSLESINKNPDYFKNCIVIYFTCKQKVLENTPELFQCRQGMSAILRFLRTNGGSVQATEGTKTVTIPKFFICGLSERNVNVVKGLKNFYTWEKFEKSISKLIPLNPEEFNSGIQSFISSKNNKISYWDFILNTKEAKDETFIQYAKELIESKRIAGGYRRRENPVSDVVLGLYKNDSSEKLARIQCIFDALEKRFEKNYPIISHFNYNYEHMKSDILIYMNAKYEILQKNEETTPVAVEKKKAKKKVSK